MYRILRSREGPVLIIALLIAYWLWQASVVKTLPDGEPLLMKTGITARHILVDQNTDHLLVDGHYREDYAGVLPAGDHPDTEMLWETYQYQVDDALNAQGGWTEAGASFALDWHDPEYPDRGDATIQIFWEYPETVHQLCKHGDDILACATADGNYCVVYVSVEVSLEDLAGDKDGYTTAGVLNHEVGHCFGLDHTKGGLMDPHANMVSTPNPVQIAWVRSQLS